MASSRTGPAILAGDAAPTADAEGLRRLLINSGALFLAYLLPRLATVAAVVVAARAVGVTAFGAYGTAAALAVILSILATLGMMQLLVRDLAQRPEEAGELIGAAHVAKTVASVLMLAVLWVLAGAVLHYPPTVVAAAMLLGVSYAIGAYAENLGAYFQSLERMGVWMQAQALQGLLTGGLGIVLVLATRSVVWFCAAPAAGQAAALVWLLARSPARIRAVRIPRWRRVRGLLGSLLPFAASFLVLTAYYKVDILLVERWRGAAEAGVYAAAYKFVDVAQALGLVLAGALYPRLARRTVGSGAGGTTGADGGSRRHPAARAGELVLLAGVPAAAALWLLRDAVVSTLYGPEFLPAGRVLTALAPVLPLLALNTLAMFVLAAGRHMWRVAWLYGGALAVNVCLNAALVPARGASGAALAMLVSESVLAVAMLRAVRAHTGEGLRWGVWLVAMGVAALAAALGSPGLPPLVATAVFVGAVAVLYSGARVVAPAELAALREALVPRTGPAGEGSGP